MPFRPLAGEVYDHFHGLLGTTNYRLRLSTGDYRKPIRQEESDLIVATYESFAALDELIDGLDVVFHKRVS